jgi:pimeloyl-ACP methyl ester carboxylesterase
MTQVTSGSGAVRFAARGHHRLAYEATNGDVPYGGPVVVLLHALLGERGDFRVVREALQEAGRIRMLLPDARGHGASAALANLAYTLDDMVAELAAILEAEAADDVHLVGHDLGGASAFAFAGAYPERVRSLTLIEPALGFLMDHADDPAVRSPLAESRDADRAAAEAAYKGMTDQALDRYLNPRWGMGWREALPKPRLAALRRNAGALGGTLTALGEASLPAGRLAAVDAPIRVLYRENAPLLSEQVGQQLEEELPRAQAVTIPGSDSPLSGAAGAAVGALLRDIVVEET